MAPVKLHTADFLCPTSRAVMTFLEANPELKKIEHIEKDLTKGETRTREYLETNPTGQLPFLCESHSPFKLWGAPAVVGYLQDICGAHSLSEPMFPSMPRPKAQSTQWFCWYSSTLEPKVAPYVTKMLIDPVVNGVPKVSGKEAELLAQRVEEVVSEMALMYTGRTKWLVESTPENGDLFTLADVMIAQILVMLEPAGYDMTSLEKNHPHVHAWLENCKADPAFQRANEKWEQFLKPLYPIIKGAAA